MYLVTLQVSISALYQTIRTYASISSAKHLKYKVVDNVAVVTIDSPGVKVLCLLL